MPILFGTDFAEKPAAQAKGKRSPSACGEPHSAQLALRASQQAETRTTVAKDFAEKPAAQAKGKRSPSACGEPHSAQLALRASQQAEARTTVAKAVPNRIGRMPQAEALKLANVR